MADAASKSGKKVAPWMLQGKKPKVNQTAAKAAEQEILAAKLEAEKAKQAFPSVAPVEEKGAAAAAVAAPAPAAAAPVMAAAAAPVMAAAAAAAKAKPAAVEAVAAIPKPVAVATPAMDEIITKRDSYVSSASLQRMFDKFYKKKSDIDSNYSLLPQYQKDQETDETKNPYFTDTYVYMPETRKAFNKFVEDNYRKNFTLPVPSPPDENACAKLFGSSAEAGVKSFLYQDFIREYIRQASPYRGVLVYHGLGSGKTCSSIAAAEALYGIAQKKVIVMTPSSLRGNFLNEISFCGFRHYQLQNYWVPFKVGLPSRDPKAPYGGQSGTEVYMRSVLSLGDTFMKRFMERPEERRVMWLPDFTKKPNEYNYTKLKPEQQFDIRAQLTETINRRVKFINYNGVTAKQLKQWACERDIDGVGMFDNSVIVIDEIHNLTRLMQGSIVPYMISRPGRIRKVPVEPVEPGIWKPKICGEDSYVFVVNVSESEKAKKDELTQLINQHPRTTNIRADSHPRGTLFKFSALPRFQRKQFDADGKISSFVKDSDATEKLEDIYKNIAADILKKGYVISETKISTETTNYKRSFLLYRLLTNAKNSKIIGLSGTPIINFPEELGILANILSGYIDCVEFSINIPSDKLALDFDKVIDSLPTTDFIRRERTGATYTYLISIFPEGYVKVFEDGVFKGIQQQTEAQQTLKEVFEQIKKLAATAGYVISEKVTFKSYPRLPVDEETFRGVSGRFIDPISLNIRNELVLKKRLTGLISYYRGSKEEYMPKVLEDAVIRCNMSDYVLDKYTVARTDEIDVERKKKEGDKGDLFADVEMYAKKKNPSSYRFRSRAICNFAFPKGIDRPFPDDPEVAVESELGTAEEAVNDVVEAVVEENEEMNKALKEAGVEDGIDDENDAAAIAKEDEATPAPEEEAGAAVPAVPAGAAAGAAGAAAAAVATAVVAEAGLAEAAAAAVEEKGLLGRAVNAVAAAASDLYETASEGAAAVVEAAAEGAPLRLLSYNERVALAMQKLDEQKDVFLKLEGQLKTYSPKLFEMLTRIKTSPGSNLVYSQFKTVEGLGVLGIVLKANGYKEIKLIEDAAGSITLTRESIDSLKLGPGAEKRFISFTGEGSRNLRSVVLNIFNGRFENLPPAIAEVFASANMNPEGKSYSDTLNKYGEICWVIGITGAGAEGISLKCVRSVHIYEPYWNMVRLDQVKGRAIRICSHADLPPDNRNVSIFTYVSYFSPDQLKGTGSGAKVDNTIEMTDHGQTSDEKVLNVSLRKKEINEKLLTILKEVAVDCELNKTENDKDIACFTVEGTSTQYMFDPDLDKDILTTDSETKPKAKGAAGAAAAESAVAQKAEADTITYRVIDIMGRQYLYVPSSKSYQYSVYEPYDRSLTNKLGILGYDPAMEQYYWVEEPSM